MSSNYQVNKAAVEQFRKELKAMLSDVGKLDKQILNQAVNRVLLMQKGILLLASIQIRLPL